MSITTITNKAVATLRVQFSFADWPSQSTGAHKPQTFTVSRWVQARTVTELAELEAFGRLLGRAGVAQDGGLT